MSSELPSVSEPLPSAVPAPVRYRALRQLIKFCIVGATSTVIDKGTLFALLSWAELNAPDVPWWGCATVSFCLAVTNGFFWNRHWTFRARAHGPASAQYGKFVLSNLIGLFLNLSFTKLFLVFFTGKIAHTVNPDPKQVLFASLCAIPCVVIWNFSVAKFWTFKAPK